MRVTGYLLADTVINMGAAFVVLVVLLCLCVIVEADGAITWKEEEAS